MMQALRLARRRWLETAGGRGTTIVNSQNGLTGLAGPFPKAHPRLIVNPSFRGPELVCKGEMGLLDLHQSSSVMLRSQLSRWDQFNSTTDFFGMLRMIRIAIPFKIAKAIESDLSE